MATHKVPQDVEAEDKLVGFLSLKQFIFVVLGIGFGYLTYFFFAKVHPITALIFIPPTLICLVLGLYQRKDQPVEVFLASALRFYLKARKRVWNQEGYEERVIITAPPVIEHKYTKSFTGAEAVSRLTSLSRMMDSRGWASKMTDDWQNPDLAVAAGASRLVMATEVGPQQPGVNLDAYTQPIDQMDEQVSPVAQAMQTKIAQADATTRQHAVAALQQARDDSQQTSSHDKDPDLPLTLPEFQAYPAMHQKTINPESSSSKPAKQQKPAAVDASPPKPKPAAAAPTHNTSASDGSVEVSLR